MRLYIFETAVLTPRQTEQVRALEQAACAPEALENGAWLSNELNFDRALPCFYLAWPQDAPGPEDAPAAFLTLFLPTREQAEVVAFTHPAHRRRGLQGAVRPCRRTVPGSGHSGIFVCGGAALRRVARRAGDNARLCLEPFGIPDGIYRSCAGACGTAGTATCGRGRRGTLPPVSGK